MTNLKVMPSESILVAIDVSKARNDILIETPGSSAGIATRGAEHSRRT